MRYVKILFLMLFLNSLVSLSIYAEENWRLLYDDADRLYQKGQLDKAEETARKAWKYAGIRWGQEDVRTLSAEQLMLNAKMYGSLLKQGHFEKDGVVKRLMEIGDRGIVKRRTTFDMVWSYGEPPEEYPASKHIILTFVNFPNHFIGIVSPDLGQYLESLPTKMVPVTFDVKYYPNGKLLSYNEVQIGSLNRYRQNTTQKVGWHSEWGHGGVRGDYVPSPWKNGPGEKALELSDDS